MIRVDITIEKEYKCVDRNEGTTRLTADRRTDTQIDRNTDKQTDQTILTKTSRAGKCIVIYFTLVTLSSRHARLTCTLTSPGITCVIIRASSVTLTLFTAST